MAQLQDPAFQSSWSAGPEAVAPGFADWIVQAAFGGLYQRPGLDLRQRQLLNLGALTTLGAEPQLAGHIRTSLRLGLAQEQIAEALVHLAIYVGVPRTLNALAVARAVFDEHQPCPSLSGEAEPPSTPSSGANAACRCLTTGP